MKFLRSEKAVSEVLGYAILLGLTITGIAMITLIGVSTIYKLQDMTTVRDAEQAFTLSDTKAGGTLLGDAPMRTGNINLGGGTVIVEPNGTGRESYMFIKSANSTFNITVPMGKVKYSYGERIVAYEGGGIWSKYPSGSIMISPPEFHFDGRTLTLPVLTVNGNASMAGKGTASVVFRKNSTIVLFPNTSMDENRTNPLNFSVSGTVYINITSDFYDAWADYARALLYTGVTKDHENSTTSIELKVVPSTLGGNTGISPSFTLRGIPTDNNTPMDNFSFNLEDVDNSFNWQLTATSGNKTLIIEIKKGTDIGIGYRDTGKGYARPAEAWTKTNAFTPVDENVYVDLLNKTNNLTYTTNTIVGANNPCAQIKNTEENTTGGFSWDDKYYSGNTTSLYNIVQHYMWLMSQPSGQITFSQCSPAGKHGPEEDSTMNINYKATGGITFLHISNNVADVTIS